MGQKFQHKSEEFFEFGLGDVGLGLWSGVASTPSSGLVHRHAQAHTTSSSPTSNSQTIVATMGRLNKRKQQLKRLVEARQARRDKDESRREEEEEVTVFNGETTVDVDIDALDENTIWQEEELEFEDAKELSKDEAEQAQGQLEELRVQPESKRPARYVGNSERSKCQRRQKQRKAVVGTKKLTSFFAHVANGDNGNKDDEQQDTNDNSNEDEKEATLNAAWKDSQHLMDVIVLLKQQRQKVAQKGESVVHSL